MTKDYDREAEGFDNAASYYAAGGIEAYDILRAKLTPEQLVGYNLGTILTYLTRYNFKHTDLAEARRDVEKAIKYHGNWLLEAIDAVPSVEPGDLQDIIYEVSPEDTPLAELLSNSSVPLEEGPTLNEAIAATFAPSPKVSFRVEPEGTVKVDDHTKNWHRVGDRYYCNYCDQKLEVNSYLHIGRSIYDHLLTCEVYKREPIHSP